MCSTVVLLLSFFTRVRINTSITYIYARIICVYVILVLHPTQTGKYAEIQQK